MSIDISDEVSEEWTSLLERWNWRDKERPKQLIKLVRKGNYIEYTVEPEYTGLYSVQIIPVCPDIPIPH